MHTTSKLNKLLAALVVIIFSISGSVIQAVNVTTKNNLTIKGSDSMGPLVQAWAKAFAKDHADITFEISANGSATAPLALINGTAVLGPMSRKMTTAEITAFEEKYGYKPMEMPVAIDAIGVFVNKANPITSLTIEDIDAIFSTSRKCGSNQDVTEWSELGGNPGKITTIGRNNQSGTYNFFRQHAMCQGEFKTTVIEAESTDQVLKQVVNSVNGIGYASIGHINSNTKVLAIAEVNSKNFVVPTNESIIKGEYPLGRYLYIYANRQPHGSLETQAQEFIKFILSAEGQAIARESGFVSLPESLCAKIMTSLLH